MKTTEPEDIWSGITVLCDVHRQYDKDCERCHAEYAARSAVMDQLQAEGNNLAAFLARQNVQMPQAVLTAIKVDLIVDTLFTDQKNRLLFEAEFGRRMIENLKEAVKIADNQPQVIAPEKKLTVVRNGKRPRA